MRLRKLYSVLGKYFKILFLYLSYLSIFRLSFSSFSCFFSPFFFFVCTFLWYVLYYIVVHTTSNLHIHIYSIYIHKLDRYIQYIFFSIFFFSFQPLSTMAQILKRSTLNTLYNNSIYMVLRYALFFLLCNFLCVLGYVYFHDFIFTIYTVHGDK